MAEARPDVQKLLAMLAAVPGPQMHEVDPLTARTVKAIIAEALPAALQAAA